MKLKFNAIGRGILFLMAIEAALTGLSWADTDMADCKAILEDAVKSGEVQKSVLKAGATQVATSAVGHVVKGVAVAAAGVATGGVVAAATTVYEIGSFAKHTYDTYRDVKGSVDDLQRKKNCIQEAVQKAKQAQQNENVADSRDPAISMNSEQKAQQSVERATEPKSQTDAGASSTESAR
jgi:hypothetical protein